MKRKIISKLIRWKQSAHRKPLIIKGARQVGKTYITLEFGKEYYKNCVYFNFENNTELSKIFERDFNPERIILELSAISGQSIFKEDTLIFLDEIQECGKALNSLKYFNEQANDYHIIAAGSLLGVAVNRAGVSYPVGKVDSETLYPLDFEEFLMALNQDKLFSLIRENFNNNTEFSLHETAMDYYRKYLAIGGMPAAVLQYVQKEDFDYVLPVQKNINDAYIADMAKYASPTETIKLMATMQSLPAQLAKENKKFQYKVIKTGARAKDYEIAIDWLDGSGIINKVCKVNEGKSPLKAFADYSSFKLYLTDTGLLCSSLGISANKLLFQTTDLDDFKGVLTENYVAFALKANGYTPFYWESNGQAEVDFVIQDKNGGVIPVVVKAAQNVRAKSLNIFISKYEPKYSIRISGKNFGFENNIKFVPLYAVFCI